MQLHETTSFPDPVDRASHEGQLELERALAAAKAKQAAERPLPYKGTCYNCDEPLDRGERFCDEDCRDDYDWRTKRRSANGKTLQ